MRVHEHTATTLVVSSPMPQLEDIVTFMATVTVETSGSGMSSGTVTFVNGTSPLGTSALDSNGLASFVTSNLWVANHTITAVYSGAGDFFGSTSAALTVLVLRPALVPSFTMPSLLTEASGVQGGDPADLDYWASGHVRTLTVRSSCRRRTCHRLASAHLSA